MLCKSLRDGPAVVSLLKSCAQRKDLDGGLRLHADVARTGLLEANIFVGNAVVNFYAKCGSLVLALEVFNHLLKKDVVSWNVLIAGYAQHEHGLEALACFRKMKYQGFHPNRCTFLSVLKAVISIGDGKQSEEICAQIAERNLLKTDIAIGNAVVDMFTKCGFLSKAQDVFERLPARNVVTWNALIAGYAEHGDGQMLFNCLMQMQLEGLQMDNVTILCSLQACGLLGALDVGQWIHAEIARKGWSCNEIEVFNALIDMYSKCNSLCKAKEVFGSLQVRNAVSWNSLIGGLIQHGYGEEALMFYEQMVAAACVSNSVTLLCTLKACIMVGTLCHGHRVHAYAVRVGLDKKDSVLGTALVDMYAKCAGILAAQGMFDRLVFRTRASWNVLIAGYQQAQQSGMAISCFELMCREGHSPDALTFLSIVKACGDLGAGSWGTQIHTYIDNASLQAEDFVVVANALVDMYAKCGLLPKSKEVFDSIPLKSVVSWNALIAGYADHGHSQEALTCFEQMHSIGTYPDEVTFVYILKACGSMGDFVKGQKIHDWILRENLFKHDSVVATALVNMYIDFGMLLEAETVSDASVRDEVSWNALISGYTHQMNDDRALQCYEQMQEEGFCPNAVTFVSILRACASSGAALKGQEIHAEISRMGSLGEDMLIGTALVSMYAGFGMVHWAQAVFDMLPVQDRVLHTELLKGYAQLGDDESVSNLYRSMMLDGEEPDAVILMAVLTACSHAGLIDEGQMYFVTMSTGHGLTPTFEHHSCMLDFFGRVGTVHKAASVIHDMPFLTDLSVWNSLLGACQKHGHVEFGRVAFAHANQLNEKELFPFVSMRNIFAGAGMRKEADSIEATRVLRSLF